MSSIISRYLFDSRPTAYILGAFCVLLYLMGLIHFVYRFNKNLFILILNIRNNNDTADDIYLDHGQLQLLQLIAKFTLLSTFQ